LDGFFAREIEGELERQAPQARAREGFADGGLDRGRASLPESL